MKPNTDPFRKFRDRVQLGDLDYLSQFSGEQLNEYNEHTEQTLFIAATIAATKPGIIEFLLKKPGINPNLPDSKGRTALMIAADLNNVVVVEALLGDKRVDLDATDRQGWKAIDYAERTGLSYIRFQLSQRMCQPEKEEPDRKKLKFEPPSPQQNLTIA